MNEPADHLSDGSQPDTFGPEPVAPTEDTIETSLADDLLSTEETQVLADPPVPVAVAAQDDEDDYLAPEGPRSRWTTGLVVALIFAVGVLCGVVLTKTLSPSPPAQVVYVLNDGNGGSANPFPPGGMPSGAIPTGAPPSAPTSTDAPR